MPDFHYQDPFPLSHVEEREATSEVQGGQARIEVRRAIVVVHGRGPIAMRPMEIAAPEVQIGAIRGGLDPAVERADLLVQVAGPLAG